MLLRGLVGGRFRIDPNPLLPLKKGGREGFKIGGIGKDLKSPLTPLFQSGEPFAERVFHQHNI